jgi:hypothetical protein
MDNQTQQMDNQIQNKQPYNITIENEQYLTTKPNIETYPHQLISVGTNSRIGIKYMFKIPSNTSYYLNISGKKTSQQNISILLNESIENSTEQLYYSSNSLFKIYNSSYSEIIKKKNINFNLIVYIYIDKSLPKSGFIINSINLILNNGLISHNISSKTYKSHSEKRIYNISNTPNSKTPNSNTPNNMTITYEPIIPILQNNSIKIYNPIQNLNNKYINSESDITNHVNTIKQFNAIEQDDTEQIDNIEQVNNSEQENQLDDDINYIDIKNKLLEFSKKIDEDLSKEDITDNNIISDLVSKINKLSEINTEIETNYSKLIKKQTDKIQKLNICIGLDNINDFDNSMSQSYDQYPSIE